MRASRKRSCRHFKRRKHQIFTKDYRGTYILKEKEGSRGITLIKVCGNCGKEFSTYRPHIGHIEGKDVF